MLTSCIDASPAEVLTIISQVLHHSAQPSTETLSAVQKQLVAFGAAAAAETVIEGYYGCIITEHLQRAFELATDVLPRCVNLSHRAVRRVCVAPGEHPHSTIRGAAWAAGWRNLRQQHAAVDMYVTTPHRDRSLRRADLYVVAAGEIISVEYKYVGPDGVWSPEGCAAQMRPYLDTHGGTRLVVYSGAPSGTAVRGLDTIRDLLPADVPLVVYGPPVAAVGRPGKRPER